MALFHLNVVKVFIQKLGGKKKRSLSLIFSCRVAASRKKPPFVLSSVCSLAQPRKHIVAIQEIKPGSFTFFWQQHTQLECKWGGATSTHEDFGENLRPIQLITENRQNLSCVALIFPTLQKKKMIYTLWVTGSRCTSLPKAPPTFRLLKWLPLAAKLTVRMKSCRFLTSCLALTVSVTGRDSQSSSRYKHWPRISGTQHNLQGLVPS